MNGANTGELTCFSEHVKLFSKYFMQFSPDDGETVDMICQRDICWALEVKKFPKVPYILQYRSMIVNPDVVMFRVSDGVKTADTRYFDGQFRVQVVDGKVERWELAQIKKVQVVKKRFDLLVAMRKA